MDENVKEISQEEIVEEIIEFPIQDTFNEDDMSIIEEVDTNVSNENK